MKRNFIYTFSVVAIFLTTFAVVLTSCTSNSMQLDNEGLFKPKSLLPSPTPNNAATGSIAPKQSQNESEKFKYLVNIYMADEQPSCTSCEKFKLALQEYELDGIFSTTLNLDGALPITVELNGQEQLINIGFNLIPLSSLSHDEITQLNLDSQTNIEIRFFENGTLIQASNKQNSVDGLQEFLSDAIRSKEIAGTKE